MQQLQKEQLNQLQLINSYEDQANELQEEIDAIKEKQKKLKEMSQDLRDNLRDKMIASGIENIKTGDYSLSIKTSESLQITDQEKIPAKFKTIEQVIKIDKNWIKKEMKVEEIKGCKIVESKSLMIKKRK
jgi:uncharacterized protein (DUF3084 family)